VFESGSGAGVEAWERVFPDVAGFAPVVSYDRAGIGQSEPDGHRPTPQHVAKNLYALLEEVGAMPPYVLVGHSLGGPFIRMFAGMYPDKVGGLVYVDPTEMWTEKDELNFYRAMGISAEELLPQKRKVRQVGSQFIEQAPPGLRAEFEVFMDLYYHNYFADFRSLPSTAKIPISVLMHAKLDPAKYPPDLFPCKPEDCHARYLPLRIAWLSALALDSSDGTFTLATNSGHNVQDDDPSLVIWAIRRVVFAARDRR
jgi:pimeloyl-ACP methyl ester carboxylesterase